MSLKIFYKFGLFVLVFSINAADTEMAGVPYAHLAGMKESEIQERDEQLVQERQTLSRCIGEENIQNNIRLFNLSKRIWLYNASLYKVPNDIAKSLRAYKGFFDRNKGAEISRCINNIINDNLYFFNFKKYQNGWEIVGFVKSVSGILVRIGHTRYDDEKDEFGQIISSDAIHTESYCLLINSEDTFKNLTANQIDFINTLEKIPRNYFYTVYTLPGALNKTYSEIKQIMSTFITIDSKLLCEIYCLEDLNSECCCAIQ